MRARRTTLRTFSGTGAVIAFGAWATAAHAGSGQPCHGRLTGSTTGHPCGGQFCIAGHDAGRATNFGRVVMDKTVVVSFTNTPCAGGVVTHAVESARLTAANGDYLDLQGSGDACHGPNGSTATITLSPTGGTGRFAASAGTITEHINADAHGTETIVLSGSLSS